MYCTPPETRKARIKHRCHNCGEAIDAGSMYVRWTSFEDKAEINKMHPECLSDLQDAAGGDSFEYIQFNGERPTP